MSSFRQRILDEILRVMREDMRFEPVGGDDIAAIKPAAIFFRRLPAPGQGIYQPLNLEESPCIVVTGPKVRIPPNEGENYKDDWYFDWMIQICTKSLGNTGKNQDTVWKWQEDVADQFNFFWLNDVINDARGCVREGYVTMIDDVDEKQWARATSFAAGVMVTTIVRKKRRPGD